MLSALGYTEGLWSPLRGLARATERCRALLAAADAPRHGDLDGRGNLSESALVAWIDHVLDVCIDQVRFMTKLLDLGAMQGRIAACLSFDEETLRSEVRRKAPRPLHYPYLTGGDLERGQFKLMTGWAIEPP